MGERGRGLREELRILEQRHEAPGIGRFAAQRELALRILAAHRVQFELGEPGVVGQDARHVVEHLHGAGERVLALEREVVVADTPLELGAQRVGYGGAFARLIREVVQRDRLLALLP